jgi:hypothetical protein
VGINENKGCFITIEVKDFMKVSMEVSQKNPKPRVQQFGTSILQVGAMQWHQVLAFDNLHCETLLSRDCNFKIIFSK